MQLQETVKIILSTELSIGMKAISMSKVSIPTFTTKQIHTYHVSILSLVNYVKKKCCIGTYQRGAASNSVPWQALGSSLVKCRNTFSNHEKVHRLAESKYTDE